MLALAWRWDGSSRDREVTLSTRLGASLCAGIGGHAGTASVNSIHFAYRALRSSPASGRSWRPEMLPDGKLAAFHGYFDNPLQIAAELGAESANPTRLYALAVEQWGERADQKIIGEYCALIADPDRGHLRLSRSPLRAPPLYYHHGEDLAAAASVPRALFAAGVEQRLNETCVADSAMRNFMDEEASWFEQIAQVPLGAVVELERGRERALRRYYSLLEIPDQHVTSDAEVLERAGALLDEGVKACLAGFNKPGSTLSG